MALLTLAGSLAPAMAAERVNGLVYPEPTDRFGRIIFAFDKPVAHEVEMTPGVLVLKLEEPVSLDVSQLPDRMSRYVSAARVDPDGKAIRLALAQALVVNKMEAAEKVFVDLLPSTWQGLPPPLPAEVVAELARRAEEAERRAYLEAERQRRLLNAPKMQVHVAEAPTFSRISFDWSVNDVKASVTREREEVKVAFDVEIDPDISRLTAQPPKHLEGARWERQDGGTVIVLKVSPDVKVRSFAEEGATVVDLSLPFGAQVEGPQTVVDAAISVLQSEPAEDAATSVLSLDMRTPVPVPPRRGERAGSVDVSQRPLQGAADKAAAPPVATAPADAERVEAPAKSPEPQVAEALEQQIARQGEGQPAPAATEAAGTIETAPIEAEAEKALQQGAELAEYAESLLDGATEAPAPETAKTPEAPEAQDAPARVAQGWPAQEGQLVLNPVTGKPVEETGVRVIETAPRKAMAEAGAAEPAARAAVRDITSTRVGNSLRLTVPFDEPVAAAVFQRAGRLWAVFQGGLPLDTRVLRNQSENFLTEIETRREGDVQVVTARMLRPLLITAAQMGNDWVITMGDLILEPTEPISLVRGQREDGGSIISAQTRGIGNVYWFDDATVGDRLAVVTLAGPARGFLKDQAFVEFSALATAHGMAFVPATDDVAVRAGFEEVVVSREHGLTISGGGVHQYVPGRKSVGYGARPGQLEYTDLVAASPSVFFGRLRDLMAASARAEPEEKSKARMDVARFMLANDYVLEALGIMRMAAEDDPLLAKDPAFNIVRGVARALAGRTAEAREDLSVHGLDNDPDAALWRALVAVDEGDYRAAQLLLEEGRFALNSYPAHVRVRFHLAAVKADIATKDMAAAMLRLDVLETETMDGARRAEARLYRGQVLEMMGRFDDALEAYDAGLEEARGPVRAESMLRKTALETQLGRITHKEGIDRLERLALAWRGDDIEINTLRTLGQYYVAEGQHRQAFEVLKAAVVADEGSEYTRLFQDEMDRAFVNYFLGPEAEKAPALEALALYYDFREMTPIGRQGDEIIRRLADRLVEVDLLAQATELLDYQIENRLRGAGRSQVAARLAYVHLLDKNPEAALSAIQRTRQNVLPAQLQRERNLLEARALADLGRTALSMELLRAMDGPEVERLKADTLWRARDWQGAGEQIERMLGDAWQRPEPLSDEARHEVLRGAVALALAGDDLGLQRYRSKFAAKMSNSPDANAFAVVTEPVNVASPDFQTVAREIADVDTLKAFLKDFRERYGYAAQGAARASAGEGAGQRAQL